MSFMQVVVSFPRTMENSRWVGGVIFNNSSIVANGMLMRGCGSSIEEGKVGVLVLME